MIKVRKELIRKVPHTPPPLPSPMGKKGLCLNVCIFVITNAFFHNYVQLLFYFLKCQTCLKTVTEMSTFKTRAILGGWGWSLFALLYSICIKTNTHTCTHTCLHCTNTCIQRNLHSCVQKNNRSSFTSLAFLSHIGLQCLHLHHKSTHLLSFLH